MIDESVLIERLELLKNNLSHYLSTNNKYLTGVHVNLLFDKIIDEINTMSESNNEESIIENINDENSYC